MVIVTRRVHAGSKATPGRRCKKSTRAGTRPIHTISSGAAVRRSATIASGTPNSARAAQAGRCSQEPRRARCRDLLSSAGGCAATLRARPPREIARGARRMPPASRANRGGSSSGCLSEKAESESAMEASKRAAGPASRQKASSARSSSVWVLTRPPTHCARFSPFTPANLGLSKPSRNGSQHPFAPGSGRG